MRGWAEPPQSGPFERLEVVHRGETVHFAVVRSPRRKRTSVVIGAGGIHIAAPTGQSLESIRAALIPQLDAVAARVAALAQRQGPPSRERQFVSGESLRLLGRPYILRVLPGESPVVERRGTRIYVTSPDPVATREALEDWYRLQAAEVFAQRVPLWAARLGVTPGQVLVRSQKTRWGSCDAQGNLRLNWRLVLAPMSLIDYVIAHELAHLRSPDHSPQFWTHLRAVMPDYPERRERLAREGARYVL